MFGKSLLATLAVFGNILGGFFVATNQVKAVTSSVIINEFVSRPSNGQEWVELLNITDAPVSLDGWKFTDLTNPQTNPNEVDMLALSGIIPANGVMVFNIGSVSKLNNSGDSIGFYDNTAGLIQRVTYGSVVSHSADFGLEIAPAVGQSATYSGSTWSISGTSTKGWFNDAVDYSCPEGVLTAPEGSSNSPILNSIASCLSSGVSVVTNMGSLTNPSIATSLSFEKRTTVSDSSTAVGKIVFVGPLNLTDQNTVNYLKMMGQKLDIANIGNEVRVGLNTIVSGSTESNFKTAAATITMYGLTGIHTTPNLIVKNNSGVVISPSDNVNYPSITSKIFDDTTHTYVFNTDHFTTFETDSTSADLTDIALSGTPASYSFAGGTYTYNGVVVANSVSSITVTPTGAGIITMSLDGEEPVTLTSGVASDEVALIAGTEKTITIMATETGKSVKTYTIKIMRTLSSAKTITAFSFPSGTGVINETTHTISVNVSNSTNVTALVATFITTGASVSIATTPQVSGITANDFTIPKSYTVTAENGTTQDYVVTVTVLAATQTANSSGGGGGGGSYVQYAYQPSITPVPTPTLNETPKPEVLSGNDTYGNPVNLLATVIPIIKATSKIVLTPNQPISSSTISKLTTPTPSVEPSAQQASILGTIGNIAGLGTGNWFVALIVILAIIWIVYRLIKRALKKNN